MKPNVVAELNSTGHIWFTTKITTVLSCQMDLRKYPMDTQSCPVTFGSISYTMDTMYFTWLDSPVELDPSIKLPAHTITKEILYNCTQKAKSCLEIRFVMKRDIGFYIMQMYLPSGLIVILSWLTFWISIDKVAERVSVGLVLILTMTTMNAGIQSSLPQFSYIKLIDIWMSTSLTFVFASLVEVAAVNAISKRKGNPTMPKSASMGSSDQSNNVEAEIEIAQAEELVNSKNFHGKSQTQKIDKICRVGFPLAFLMFNVGYWSISLMI